MVEAQQHPESQIEGDRQISRARGEPPALRVPVQFDVRDPQRTRGRGHEKDIESRDPQQRRGRRVAGAAEKPRGLHGDGGHEERAHPGAPCDVAADADSECRGRPHWRSVSVPAQARLNTSVPLVPPNPKLFFTA